MTEEEKAEKIRKFRYIFPGSSVSEEERRRRLKAVTSTYGEVHMIPLRSSSERLKEQQEDSSS